MMNTVLNFIAKLDVKAAKLFLENMALSFIVILDVEAEKLFLVSMDQNFIKKLDEKVVKHVGTKVVLGLMVEIMKIMKMKKNHMAVVQEVKDQVIKAIMIMMSKM